MKRRTLFITTLVLILGCSNDPINESNLVTRGGVKYEINSTKPYTGSSLKFNENGRIILTGNYKNGIKNGLFEKFYDNGQLKETILFDGGSEIGESILFSENGDSIFYQNFDKDSSVIKNKLYFIESDHWVITDFYVEINSGNEKDLTIDKKFIDDGRLYIMKNSILKRPPGFEDSEYLNGIKVAFKESEIVLNGIDEEIRLTYNIDFKKNKVVINDVKDDTSENIDLRLSESKGYNEFTFSYNLDDLIDLGVIVPTYITLSRVELNRNNK